MPHTNNKSRYNNPLITGTLLLSCAGLASRLIGFFYKIFLSRTIGAENLGLYQLTLPVLSLGMSLTSSGVQTALSRTVARVHNSLDRVQKRYFTAAVMISLSLAAIFGIIVLWKSNWIASELLGDERCSPLLTAAVCSLFPGCVHACMNGYYYGKKEAAIPAASQLAEQAGRVGAVYLVFHLASLRGESIGAIHAMWGMAIGECFGVLVSGIGMIIGNITRISAKMQDSASQREAPAAVWDITSPHTASAAASNRETTGLRTSAASPTMLHAIRSIGSLAFPMTFNRVVISICHSIENALIPQKLILFGMTQSVSLSLYGTLSGMALSVIHFPSVLTGSLSDLLLPSVSEAHASGSKERISHLIRRSIAVGLSFGFIFTVLFLLLGDFIGNTLFNSQEAGEYIRRLAFVCPFLYLSGLLGSILHGLGRPKMVLFINLLSCLIRIAFIILLVPTYGVGAYLWSMLLSQVFCALGSITALWNDLQAFRF